MQGQMSKFTIQGWVSFAFSCLYDASLLRHKKENAFFVQFPSLPLNMRAGVTLRFEIPLMLSNDWRVLM